MKTLRRLIPFLFILVLVNLLAKPAWAFCGFYVAKAEAKLYNQASQVVIARQGDRTVLTMANDYQGEVKDFALVVPVPVVLQQDQVHVGDPKIIERLDGFSAPRLVEYFDGNPCQIYLQDGVMRNAAPASESMQKTRRERDSALGVTVEAKFTVGEYDIVILSAKESNGLGIWLNQNGYKIPQGASQLLRPYIRQNMKFFVAKVNLKEFNRAGFNSLRPLMMAYESPKFMLPIRLGMINGQGEQDLIVYLLSPQGQIELTNYRTVKVPSDIEIPEFVQKEFTDFYKAMFKTSYDKEGKKVAFLEYTWDMGNCDPCSAEPLNPNELRQAGVFWLDGNFPANVFITRLHVRYTRDKFPEDLQFQDTANRQQFQGRYVIRHPFKGEMNCQAAKAYQKSVRERQEKEAQTLAQLTGWDLNQIRRKIDFVKSESTPWWRQLWR
jgi:hypothetical protein